MKRILLACLLLPGCATNPATQPAGLPVTPAVEPVATIQPSTQSNEEWRQTASELNERLNGLSSDVSGVRESVEKQGRQIDALSEAVKALVPQRASKPVSRPSAPVEKHYRLLLLSGPNCSFCKQTIDLMATDWLKPNWKVGRTPDCDIQIVEDDILARSLGVESYPCFVLVRDGTEVGRVIPAGQQFEAHRFVNDACDMYNANFGG